MRLSNSKPFSPSLSTPEDDGKATTVGCLGEDVAVVCATPHLAPGAVFALADFDTVDSDNHHSDVATTTVDSIESDDGVLTAVGGEGGLVSAVVDANGSASYPVTLMEWESAAEESDVINGSLSQP